MLTPAIVNVVFEGNLSPDRTLGQVLEDILAAVGTDTAVLRIACPAKSVSGRLAVARGRYIVGAQVDGDAESGWAAVRKLLSVAEGNFAFLDTEGRFPFDVDPSLNIAIDRILELMPSLPENPGELFDEKALLDEVFAAGGLRSGSGQDSYEVLPKPAAGADTSNAQAQPESAWAAIQPLLLNDAGCSQQGPLLAGFGHEGGSHSLNAGERRITFGKLKAAAITGLSWRRPGALAAIVLLLLVLALAAWSLSAHWRGTSSTSGAPEAPSGLSAQ